MSAAAPTDRPWPWSGAVCLQGGAEFGPRCAAMDTDLLARTPGGRVVVVPLAAAPGREYATAGANGARHLAGLGGADVAVAPDARADPAGARRAVAGADLLVLPGGSPARLLAALTAAGLDELIRELLAAGRTVMGASAGAMVLCEHTVLPEGGRPRLAAGLGVVAGALVVPHWRGDRRWLDVLAGQVPDRTTVYGIPEQSGILLTGDGQQLLGDRPAVRFRSG